MFGYEKNIFLRVISILKENDKFGIIDKLVANKAITIDEKDSIISIQLPFFAPLWLSELQDLSKPKLDKIFKTPFSWKVTNKVSALKSSSKLSPIKNVKNIIIVGSGKGGVGKSTVSVNLALALSKNGAKVGLLDADLYGPSLPLILGEKETKPDCLDGKLMEPITAYGVSCNSIGFLIDESDAMIWRGPMASKALMQIINETNWPELDYLIVDLPPGTGDIQLTLSQQTPVTSALIVTTPQDLALIDAMKGIVMFNKVNIHISGIIENMSYFSCPNCQHIANIFGVDGGKILAAKYEVPFIGQLPLHIEYREDSDSGLPTVAKESNEELVTPYLKIAESVAMGLYKDLPEQLPDISIKNI